MKYRSIRYETAAQEQISKLAISYERWDEVLQGVEEMLSMHPEKFPLLPGTKIRLCRTNEFFNMSFDGIPSMALYFHFDDEKVHILWIEASDLHSYGV